FVFMLLCFLWFVFYFFFSSRRRHTRFSRDWSSDVCSSDLYYSFTNFDAFSTFADLNVFITIAAIVTFSAQLIFLYNFFYSMFRGRVAPANPWRSNTLEWTTPVKVGHGNWPGPLPIVYRWPYDYSKPGAKDDFIPQTVPFSATPESNLPEETKLISEGYPEVVGEEFQEKEDEGRIGGSEKFLHVVELSRGFFFPLRRRRPRVFALMRN